MIEFLFFKSKGAILNKEEKKDIISQFRFQENDTGSTEVQVALLSRRVSQLSEHLDAHHHDHHSRHALLKLIGQRRRLLAYLNKNDAKRYHSLINRLGLRR
jgi:small subunit ribosomal protein S15